MKKTNRDQRQFDIVQKHHLALTVSTLINIVGQLGDPYAIMPGLGGMTAYPPKAMAIVCFLRICQKTTFRKMTSYLEMNPDLVRQDRPALHTFQEYNMPLLRNDTRLVSLCDTQDGRR